jgi:hypothetical protein
MPLLVIRDESCIDHTFLLRLAKAWRPILAPLLGYWGERLLGADFSPLAILY